MFALDLAAYVYFGCFIFGLSFSVLSLALGSHHPRLPHLGQAGRAGLGHAHIAHGTHRGPAGRGHQGTDDAPSVFNLQSLVTFLTFFGGVGFALSAATKLGSLAVLGTSGTIGVLGAGTFFLFLSKVLYANQTPWLRSSDFSLPGTIAHVSSRIGDGGTGEVVFTKMGRRRVEAARAHVGLTLDRGTEVVIVGYERGFAMVEPSAQFFAEPTERNLAKADRVERLMGAKKP